MRLHRFTVLLALTASLLSTGCGGSSSKSSSSTTSRTRPAASTGCNPAAGARFGEVFVTTGAQAHYLGVEQILTAFPLWASGQSGFPRAPKAPLCPQAGQAMAAVILKYVARHEQEVMAESDPKRSDPAAYLRTHGLDCGSECNLGG